MQIATTLIINALPAGKKGSIPYWVSGMATGVRRTHRAMMDMRPDCNIGKRIEHRELAAVIDGRNKTTDIMMK